MSGGWLHGIMFIFVAVHYARSFDSFDGFNTAASADSSDNSSDWDATWVHESRALSPIEKDREEKGEGLPAVRCVVLSRSDVMSTKVDKRRTGQICPSP
ncbi:hypothetical protein E4U43_005470 [Claviceps pusilla]|uniref:Secreted protein n=1 Tax=Claviceps pusilla TaxID=123648 RepID=A0A9P7T2K4_9HYPO|nr:hypothetical protein E4U43_005470 [Claviceps pusilla]